MSDRLFDPGEPAKKPRASKPPSASDMARDNKPLFEVRVGTTSYYFRAVNEEAARMAWRFRYASSKYTYTDDELRTRRLLHADMVELLKVDPKLAKKLASL